MIDHNKLEEVENAKLLGVFVDSTRVSFKLSLLRRIRKYLRFETQILLYNFYIKPIIEYCCMVWGRGCRENENVITKLQK